MPSPITAPYPFPKELTVADWKENTDITKPQHTGIKGELTKVKHAYDSVDWSKFYARSVCAKQHGVTVPADVEPKILDVKEEYRKTVEVLRKALLACSSKANEVAQDLKKKTLVAKKNREQVEKIDKVAGNTATALKDNGVYFKQVIEDFEAEKTRLQRVVDIAKDAFGKAVKKLLVEAGNVKANPTVAVYDSGATTGFYQSCRAVGTTLPFLERAYPRLIPLREKWKKISNDGFLPKRDEEVPDKLKTVLLLLKELQAAIR